MKRIWFGTAEMCAKFGYFGYFLTLQRKVLAKNKLLYRIFVDFRLEIAQQSAVWKSLRKLDSDEWLINYVYRGTMRKAVA